MSRPSLTVVLPVYRTRAAAPELLRRLEASCPADTEIVVIDDACPERSGAAFLDRGSRLQGRVVTLSRNVGQHAAVLIGLTLADGGAVAVMDADLQDRPEDLPLLMRALGELTGPDAFVVAAGRRGRYEGLGRRSTGVAYRRLQAWLTHGRIPADAGMFCVMTATARTRVLDLEDPVVPLISAFGASGLRVTTMPLIRDERSNGRSSYRSWARLRIATRALVTVSPLYPLARSVRRRRWTPPAVDIAPFTSLRDPAHIEGTC